MRGLSPATGVLLLGLIVVLCSLIIVTVASGVVV